MDNLYENIQILCDRKGIKPGRMCADLNLSRGLMTDLKMGRKKTVNAETANKIAEYFGVSVKFLLTGEEDEKKPLVNDDEELTEILQRAKDDPHIRMLFSVTKNATPEDIEKAIKIIQTLKGD